MTVLKTKFTANVLFLCMSMRAYKPQTNILDDLIICTKACSIFFYFNCYNATVYVLVYIESMVF